MTRVCLIGEVDIPLRANLFEYETPRDALSAYDISEPYENTLAVTTISVGAAVSLLNDLDWYLRRFVTDAIVLEPSISTNEWLSRPLVSTLRNDQVSVDETTEFLKIYGVETNDDGNDQLTEPMFARRIDDETPTYDLHDVTQTLIIRITATEYGE